MKVEWTTKATKQLLKLQISIQQQISQAVWSLNNPKEKWTNVKPLKNHTYDYRLRVGNYRVLFDCFEEIQIVEIQEVKKRDDRTY